MISLLMVSFVCFLSISSFILGLPALVVVAGVTILRTTTRRNVMLRRGALSSAGEPASSLAIAGMIWCVAVLWNALGTITTERSLRGYRESFSALSSLFTPKSRVVPIDTPATTISSRLPPVGMSQESSSLCSASFTPR
jgi:hypothetical protein